MSEPQEIETVSEDQIFFKFQVAKAIAATPLLIALFELPYGYYVLLRLWTCPLAIAAAYACFCTQKFKWLTIPFGIIALMFNPLIPVHFEREVWQVIDFIVAAMFLLIPMPQSKEFKEMFS